MFIPVKRATLLIPSGPLHDQTCKHLFVLLTNPADWDGVPSVLMVPISSVRARVPHDPTCLLYAGDHPFITHDSYVFYAKTRIESQSKLMQGVRQGALVACEMMSTSIFARICYGLEQSPHAPKKHLAFYRSH